MEPQLRPSEVIRDPKGRFPPGVSGNPGGRSQKQRELQAMLDKEHRNLENMRTIYSKLQAASFRELDEGKNEGWTKMYLERLQGPVKDLEDSRQPEDMTDEEIEAALRDGN